MNYACIIYFSEFYKTRFGLKQIILLICIIAIFFLGIFRIVFNGDHAKEPVPITGGNSARIGKNFWFPFFAFDDDSTDPPSSISSSYRPELKRAAFSYVQGSKSSLISYGSNYATMALLFAPDYTLGSVLPMLDVRGHRFNNDTYAANIGIAGRYIPATDSFLPFSRLQCLLRLSPRVQRKL